MSNMSGTDRVLQEAYDNIRSLERRLAECHAKLAEAEKERDYQASECALLRKYRVEAAKGD